MWPKTQEKEKERICLVHCCLISCAHAQFCFEHVAHLLRPVLCAGSSHMWQLCAVCKGSSRGRFHSQPSQIPKKCSFLPTLWQSSSNQYQWIGWCSLKCRSIYLQHVPGNVFPQRECLFYKPEQCKNSFSCDHLKLNFIACKWPQLPL